MPTLRDAHAVGAWVVVAANAVAGLWALAADRLPRLRTASLWRFTAAAEVAIAVQVGLGAALLAQLGGPGPRFHMFYGVIALFAVTILYGYRNQLRHRIYLLYGFGSLFLMGLALRAMVLEV